MLLTSSYGGANIWATVQPKGSKLQKGRKHEGISSFTAQGFLGFCLFVCLFSPMKNEGSQDISIPLIGAGVGKQIFFSLLLESRQN